MKTLLLSLLLASSAAMASEAPRCETKTITVKVCPKKPHKKKPVKVIVVKPEPVVVVAPEPEEPIRYQTYQDPDLEAERAVPADPYRPWFGIRGAIGLGTATPHVNGLVGIRLHSWDLHLGIEAYTLFATGPIGGQVLVYPFQGDRLSWHLNAGAVMAGPVLLEVKDVPRTWSLTLGTGLEYALLPWLALTADYWLAIPDPGYLASHSGPIYRDDGSILCGPGGRYANVPAIIGNAALQGRVYLGVMVRF